MDYLLLIEQIELEDEYRSMLLTEGVVSGIVNTIKRMLRYLKEKILGFLRKVISLFRRDKINKSTSSSSSSSASSVSSSNKGSYSSSSSNKQTSSNSNSSSSSSSNNGGGSKNTDSRSYSDTNGNSNKSYYNQPNYKSAAGRKDSTYDPNKQRPRTLYEIDSYKKILKIYKDIFNEMINMTSMAETSYSKMQGILNVLNHSTPIDHTSINKNTDKNELGPVNNVYEKAKKEREQFSQSINKKKNSVQGYENELNGIDSITEELSDKQFNYYKSMCLKAINYSPDDIVSGKVGNKEASTDKVDTVVKGVSKFTQSVDKDVNTINKMINIPENDNNDYMNAIKLIVQSYCDLGSYMSMLLSLFIRSKRKFTSMCAVLV